MINIMKFRPLFLVISSLMLAVSIFSIFHWGFQMSIDFAGGTVWQISYTKKVSPNILKKVFSNQKIDLISSTVSDKDATFKFKNIDQTTKTKIQSEFTKLNIGYQDLSFETLGPSLGKELVQKTIYAIIFSGVSLLIFIGVRFSDYTFGAGAIIAMIHDGIILIGAFSLFGHFFGAELDALFVTALLTTLSSSVHDTVVTFDRIRELKHKYAKIDWVELSNQAVSEVIVRSINNSMTVVFMLLALVVLGGQTTKWFATALLVGVICGTYSSTGVAIPMVLLIKDLQKKKQSKSK